ncbi:aminotransferase class V-fold PLP-dependent enzyme [Sporolactobacillus sp. THM7-7]|nr:aminotransferase class V-fold PLP-dependent enzyme [Sporolactobacillus sp. THM7-7]
METYPLESISVNDALEKQFALVDEITKEFEGHQMLTRGDLGVVKGLNRPLFTKKVERIIANFFHSESCLLLRGAGTGAIRSALHSTLQPGDTLLVHDAPIYPTTKTSIEMLGINIVFVDFNHLTIEDLQKVHFDAALIQYTRQKPDDFYDIGKIIDLIQNQFRDIPIITDDNYAVMKVHKIGVELGASLSCFSAFKLLGPEGIGCIVGNKKNIDFLRKENYSGGLQVQGHESLDVLRGLVYAPVALANQARVVDQLIDRLNNHEIPKVGNAYAANAQSKVLLVEFTEPIAQKILNITDRLGAAPYPVGAESKYEIVPMFYRVSGTFIKYDENLLNTTIRINPLRAGANTVIRILKKAINEVIREG